jgi:hypothetical protein
MDQKPKEVPSKQQVSHFDTQDFTSISPRRAETKHHCRDSSQISLRMLLTKK